MDFRVFVEPQQGATYDQQLAVAQTAESVGFSAFFRSDHYLAMKGDGLPGPTDSWVTLAGIARETTRIRLGTLVSSATFRYPGPLAISVAEVDAMSGGRVDFGLGTGWFEPEHLAYGIPFPSLGERFDRFEEQLDIITGMWATPIGETFDYSGTHYTLRDCPALPKPVQPSVPIVIGGRGPSRTPALAARFATEFNLAFPAVDFAADRFGRVRNALEAVGRPADDIVFSAAFVVCVGEDDARVASRAATLGRDVDELRGNSPLAGRPAEIVDRLAEYAAIGVQRVYLQLLDLADLDQLGLFASEVIPAFGSSQ